MDSADILLDMTRMDFLSYMEGVLWVRCSGDGVERFITLCAHHHIPILEIRSRDNCKELKIRRKSLYQMRGLIRKTHVRIHILRRIGLPFYGEVFRRKAMFLSCCMISILFYGWMSVRIWGFGFTGNRQITDEMLEDFIANQGIYPGKVISELSMEQLEDSLRNRYPAITWTCIKTDGNALLIHVKENPEISQVPDNISSHLTAPHDGKIISMVTRHGTPVVKLRDEVKEGDILVRGEVDITDENGQILKRYVFPAQAEITMEYEIPVQIILPIEHFDKYYTGREQIHYAIGIEDIYFPLPNRHKRNYINAENWKEEQAIGFLQIHCFREREYYDQVTYYDQDEATFILKKKFKEFFEDLQKKKIQIMQKDVKMVNDGLSYRLEGKLVVRTCEMRREPIIQEIEEDGE